MPYFIAEVEKDDAEQGKRRGGRLQTLFGSETTEMPERHQENRMRSAKCINFKWL